MPKYKVEISRTAMRAKVFEVEAEDENAAESVAIDQAFDFDFSTVPELSPDYQVEDTEEVDE